MELMNILTGEFSGYLSFIFGMIFAEETLVVTSFLVSQKLMPIYNILLAFTGVVSCNILLYFIGRCNVIKPLKKSKRIILFSKKIESIVNKLTKNKIEKAIIYSKFIFASRFIVVILIGYRKIKFIKFLRHMLFVELLWAIVAISIGLFAGESFTLLANVFKNITLIATSFVLFVVLGIYIKKKLIKRKI